MFRVGKCKKCNGLVIFNVGDSSKEEIEEFMKKSEFGQCSSDIGWHVEIGKKSDYYEINWNEEFKTIEEAKVFNENIKKYMIQ